MLVIRKVRPCDAEAIADIYNYYVLETTVSFELQPVDAKEMHQRINMVSSSFPFFVCEDSGQVVGYCYAHPWKNRAAYIHTLETTVYVAVASRGRGIGGLLMSHLVEACRATDCHTLIACITAENYASIKFHERIGFKRVSFFRQVGKKFGKWLDVVDYELLLH